MGLPFVITEGTALIVDVAGNLADVVTESAGKNRLATEATIRGRDGNYLADVVYREGVHRLATDAIVRVEQVFGFDDFADCWFDILTAGNTGDTILIHMAPFIDSTGLGERSIPGIDYTHTLSALEAGDEMLLTTNIIAALNAISDFNLHWKASIVKNNSIIHITSKYMGEYGERIVENDFRVTPSGTTTTREFDFYIRRRGKQNTGARDPRDKRLVTVGVSGEVTTIPGEVGDLYINNACDALGSCSLLVDGSVTPVLYDIPLDTEKDVFISELRFYAGGAGIGFGDFLSQNGLLPNGILVEIKSDNQLLTLPTIHGTEDFKNKFAFGSASNFSIHVTAGLDQILAVLLFETPFPLRKIGTFTEDDYIKISVQDDLDAGIAELGFIARGFKREV